VGGSCSANGGEDVTGRKPEGKRPLGRSRHRWVDNIKMDSEKIGWDIVDWIRRAEERDKWIALVNAVTKLWVL
jgi:hypothetical protein